MPKTPTSNQTSAWTLSYNKAISEWAGNNQIYSDVYNSLEKLWKLLNRTLHLEENLGLNETIITLKAMVLAHQLWFPWIGPGKDTASHKSKHCLVFIGIAVDLHFHVWAMFEKA